MRVAAVVVGVFAATAHARLFVRDADYKLDKTLEHKYCSENPAIKEAVDIAGSRIVQPEWAWLAAWTRGSAKCREWAERQRAPPAPTEAPAPVARVRARVAPRAEAAPAVIRLTPEEAAEEAAEEDMDEAPRERRRVHAPPPPPPPRRDYGLWPWQLAMLAPPPTPYAAPVCCPVVASGGMGGLGVAHPACAGTLPPCAPPPPPPQQQQQDQGQGQGKGEEGAEEVPIPQDEPPLTAAPQG
jgi:hypothetical protein